jgi:thiosulfate/3-mercaptopyruvate sulfurtransferase
MSKNRSFKRIDPATAAQLLARDKVLVLDSRDPDNYNRAHIANARRLFSANLDAILVGTPTATPVLLYCYHGNASQTYGQMFADFGFSEVYSLDGGGGRPGGKKKRKGPPK